MKTISRLPLNSLRTFEAVARLGSMARAAEDLNVQPSAVSMQIKSLTDYVGVPLFTRSGRHLALTPQGQALLPSVASGLGRIEDAIASLRNARRNQPFTLSVLPSFLHLWLLPRLPRFEKSHPSFRMRIVASRDLVDPARGDVDAAIRLGAGKWPGARVEKLMDEGLVPVCSPALRRRVGWLQPGELPRSTPLLQSEVDPWTRWSDDAVHARRRPVAIDDAVAVVSAAQQGLGVALVRTSLAQEAIANGRLVAVGQPIAYRWSYYWVTSALSAGDVRHARVLDWLRSEMSGAAATGGARRNNP